MIRILYAALAGAAATVPMTAAMRRLHARLPERERYALPPREVTGGALGERQAARAEAPVAATAMLAHFAYGAATGALFGLLPRRSVPAGIAWGLGVWAFSYLGLMPGARLLEPATRHPWRRNALMLGVHVIWGAALAASLREIELAERDAFRRGRATLPDLRP